MLIAGTSPDDALVEIVELPAQRWFVAVQYHPEFKSKPTAAHPLFQGFVGATVEHHSGRTERGPASPADSESPQAAEGTAS